MNDTGCPADVVITSQDFADCGWRQILESVDCGGYSPRWHAFRDAARLAMAEGRVKPGRVLRLLADACSMILCPGSINEPFKPFVVMEGRRSAAPEDFSEVDIELLAQVVESVDDVWLKARLADLVWLKQPNRDVRFALIAIDAYCAVPLDTETWVGDGGECWARAVGLTRLLRSGAGTRITTIESTVVKSIEAATAQDGFSAFWLAELLETNGMGKAHHSVIAWTLEDIACDCDRQGNFHVSRQYFNAACKWYRAGGNKARVIATTIAEAEAWVKEARARLSSQHPSHMVAASFYENAIQALRRIPRADRPAFRVDERIAELHACLANAGEQSLSEMTVISTPGIDLTEYVERARNAVRGKTALEALKLFCSLYGGVDVQEASERARGHLREFPLHGLVPTTMISRDGRVVAKRPGMSLGMESSNDDIVVRTEMIQSHRRTISLLVQGVIWPALEILWLEHRLREPAFVQLARESPIVPTDRSRLFGKALFAGYDRDFVSAVHLLVPQIEHMVRFHLKQSGVKTTNLDSNGIENEVGLSALMERPEAEQIMGANLCFELHALFCDPCGPNLRNELAHGLLDDEACQSIYSIYAWWFGLRLVFNTFSSTMHKATPGGEEEPRA